jgi:hypothetical protein
MLSRVLISRKLQFKTRRRNGNLEKVKIAILLYSSCFSWYAWIFFSTTKYIEIEFNEKTSHLIIRTICSWLRR